MRGRKARYPFSFWVILSLLALGQGGVPVSGSALTEEERVNIEVYRKASVAVVHIRSTVVRYGFFFQPIPARGMGSGVVLDQKGHIVTNAHVVEGAKEIEVTLFDGSSWNAHLVGSMPERDLAIIRIEAPQEKLKPVDMGDSRSLQVGQTVYAIGNPFGFQYTLTKGVISSLDRSLVTPQGAKLEGLIQTDAAINPGNSGGPLLDGEGRLIGINTAIMSPSGGSSGVGFAIPVAALEQHLPSLMRKGSPSWPWTLILIGAIAILWILARRATWRTRW
jgi:S1-C subfamily serine protease